VDADPFGGMRRRGSRRDHHREGDAAAQEGRLRTIRTHGGRRLPLTALAGATAKTCTLTEADRGRTVHVVVSGVIRIHDDQARASAGVTVR
jgi:hypothetical protein